MKLNFGLKLYSTNYDLLREANTLIQDDLFQYIELTPVADKDLTHFLNYPLTYNIHAPNENQGVNIADPKKNPINLKYIERSLDWAEKLESRYIILHPGFGDLEIALDFLKKLDNKKILIENMPKVGMNGEPMLGFNPEQIKILTRRFGFCLDFNHAIKAAIAMKVNYRLLIEEFLKLKPKVFHISDGNLDSPIDEHLDIGNGEYDFKFLVSCLEKVEVSYVTLETIKSSLEDDKRNISKLKTYF